MNLPPPSPNGKFALALFLWLMACCLSIPLWELACGLFNAYRYKDLVPTLVEILLSPLGTIAGLMLLFGKVAENGIGAIAEHYWPGFLIATGFTFWIMWRWERPS